MTLADERWVTAAERAKALVALLKSDFGQSGDDVWFYAIRDELTAHAHAVLKRAEEALIWRRRHPRPPGARRRRGGGEECLSVFSAANHLKCSLLAYPSVGAVM